MNNKTGVQQNSAGEIELYSRVETAPVEEILSLAKDLDKRGMSPQFAKFLAEKTADWHKNGGLSQQRELYEILAKHIDNGWEILQWLGFGSQMAGDFDQAKYHYEQALKLNPDFAYAKLALGQIKMMQTNFREGRDAYEMRFQARSKDDNLDWREIPLPRWRGENLKDKSIYFWAEQGVGDVVMFAAFIPHLLAQKPKRITLGIPNKLIPLFARSFPNVQIEPLDNVVDYAVSPMLLDIFPTMEKLAGNDSNAKQSLAPLQAAYEKAQHIKSFDYAAPMGDMLVNCLPEFIPAQKQKSYLTADKTKVAEIKNSLPAWRKIGRRIGISWYTSNDKDGVARNIPPALWKEILATKNCQFFSLQHHVPKADVAAFGKDLNFYPGLNPSEDIEGLIALIASLDEVITIDNSNAHLAGALGIKTSLLLPKGCNFRWPTENGSTNLWYESVKLERQTTAGDWQSVMQKIAENLGS